MKTSDTARYRGFESHLLRHIKQRNALDIKFLPSVMVRRDSNRSERRRWREERAEEARRGIPPSPPFFMSALSSDGKFIKLYGESRKSAISFLSPANRIAIFYFGEVPKYGRRGSPAKGVVCHKRSEGSNPSFSATSEQSSLCSVFFFSKENIRPLPCSSSSAKKHVLVACSVVNALAAALAYYHLFAGYEHMHLFYSH